MGGIDADARVQGPPIELPSVWCLRSRVSALSENRSFHERIDMTDPDEPQSALVPKLANRGVGLSDVARDTGLTISTISQILNGKGSYRPETQRLVRETVQRLGYHPNASARAVRKQSFGCIGLLVPRQEHLGYLFSQVVVGVESVLAQRGMHMVLCLLPNDDALDPSEAPKLFSEWMVDGVLINYHGSAPQGIGAQIERFGMSAVWLNATDQVNAVRPDDRGGATGATRHLISLGHTRIAYLNHQARRQRPFWHASARDREDGYLSAMTAADLPSLVLGDLEGIEPPDRVPWMKRVLTSPNAPTAIVCYARDDAEMVSHAMAALELLPGRDLSVIVHHDQPFRTPIGPFDVWAIDGFAMGTAAAVRLLAQLDGHVLKEGPIVVPMRHLVSGACRSPAPKPSPE